MKLTRTRRTWVVAAAVAAIVTAANASQGAYFSQSWGWVALAFLMPATVLLILDRVTVQGRLRIAFAGLMGALGIWIALSSLWSISSAASIREVERMLVYVAVALAIALVLRRGDGPAVLGGALVGVTVVCGVALATRLFPDVLETYDNPVLPYRLSNPVGYWNSLGLLASMGFVVAFGLAAHARREWHALAAAAAMPILATTLYFTFSRGAWVAQVFGFAAMVAFDPRRLRLLWVSCLAALAPFLAVVYSSQQTALTIEGAPEASAAAQGHRTAAVVAVLAVLSLALVMVARRLARRIPASRRARRRLDVLLVGLVAGLSAIALVVAGGPVHGAQALKARFDAPAPLDQTDLNARLRSFSGSGRSDQIRVAIDAGRAHPIIGTGAGSYEARWYEFRRTSYAIRDAHSLYAEMFGELGLVGLGVLIALLAIPVGAATRARRTHLVPAGVGAYLGWMAHSALDWNWELVGVTLVALLAGSAAMVESEHAARRRLRPGLRAVLVPLSVVLSLFAVVSLVGNQALFAGRSAIAEKDWNSALGHARKARALLPSSSEAQVVYGDAAAGLGDRRGAIAAYRRALDREPSSWITWLRVAQVSSGKQRVEAYQRVHELNPLLTGLPDVAYRTG